MNVKKKKRTPLTIAKKLDIIQRIESGVRPAAICKEFKVAKQTVSDIKKNTLKIKNYAQNLSQNDMFVYTKAVKCHTNNQLDEDLYKWFLDQISKGFLISCNDIQNTACKIAKLKGIQNFKASKPWLSRFLKRNNMTKTSEGDLSLIDDVDKLYELASIDSYDHNQESYSIESKGESAYIQEVLIKEEVISEDEEINATYENEENSKTCHLSEVNSDRSDEDVWNAPSSSYSPSNWGFIGGDERDKKDFLPKMIRISKKQRDELLEYISNHPEVAMGKSDQSSRESNEEHWEELTRHLNQFGPAKPVYKWKRVLYDLKFNINRNFARQNLQNEIGVDNEVRCPATDKRYINYPKASKKMDMSDFSDDENLPMENRECLYSANRRETELDRLHEVQKETNTKLNIIASSLHRIEDHFVSLNHTLEMIAKSLSLTSEGQIWKCPKRKKATKNR